MEQESKTVFHVTQNFNAPIGQYVQHIDHQVLHFDENMQMQVLEQSLKTPTQASERIQADLHAPTATAQPPYADYTRYIETTTSITVIGNLLANEAKQAKTKAYFINKIGEIVRRTQLFDFKTGTSNQQKADFTNAILAAYGYTGDKCKNITDDDFQRNF